MRSLTDSGQHIENQYQYKQRDDIQNLATPSKEALDASNHTDAIERKDESCQTDNLERKDFQAQASVKQQSESIAIQTDISPKCDQVQANIPPKNIDAGIQTEVFERKDDSSQTDNLERKDFQVQVGTRQQAEPIATQTDVSPKCDFQVQANIPRENQSIAVQTIKQEIAMPNLPSSTAETPAKKRKLSSKSTPNSSRDQVTYEQANVEATVHNSSAPQSISNGSGDRLIEEQAARKLSSASTLNGSRDQLNNQQANAGRTVSNSSAPQSISDRSGDRLNEEQAALDDSILNSEIYQIYSRNENSKEAMEQIKKLKTCILFWEPSQPFPSKGFGFVKAMDNLWKVEPPRFPRNSATSNFARGDSKFTRIKEYIKKDTLDWETCLVFRYCYTRIVMFNPDGYEYWYVANFEKGPSVSKWYRAESYNMIEAMRLAQLHVMGIIKATIKKLQFDHYKNKNVKQKSEKIPWVDFAIDAVKNDLKSFFPRTSSPSFDFHVKEIKTDTTIEMNACFNLEFHDGQFSTKVLKKQAYHGKSTCSKESFQTTGLSKNEREAKKAFLYQKMENEATKAALMEFFKERFGFTEFNDLCVDELNRPMTL